MHITFIEFDYFAPHPQQCRFSDITWALATALVAQGHQVTVVAPCLATSEPPHPQIAFVPVPLAITQRENIGIQIKRAWHLASAAKQVQADIYHVHQSVMAAMMTLRGVGSKTVWHGHSNYCQRIQYEHIAHDRSMDYLIKSATWIASQRVLVAALGSQVVPFWQQAHFPSQRIRIAPNGTALSLTPPEANWSCDAWKGVQFKAVYVGRLSADKGGQIELIHALTHLSMQALGLAILGDGTLRPALETEAKGLRVSFCGTVSHEEALRALVSADLLILTSYAEMFPRTILEAWSVGTAVMSTNVGAIGDYLHDHDNGYLLTSHDPTYIAQRLCGVLEDEIERLEIGRNGQATAQAMTWENVAPRYIEIYQSLLHKV